MSNSSSSLSTTNTNAATTTSTTASPQSNLASYCPALKYAYETCFQRWYTEEFLSRPSSSHVLPCEEQFATYKKCVIDSMKSVGLAEILPRIDENQPGKLQFNDEKKK
jgi:hypothetical protein